MATIFESPETFIFVLGARGTGKTYGATQWLIQNCKPEHKFLFMRRTKAEIDVINAGNIYAEHSPDYGMIQNSPFYDVGMDFGETRYVIGRHIALSSISHIRGFSMLDVDFVYFDEFIPEIGTVIRKHGGEMMLNAYETINRNRELQGKRPVKCVFTSNYNTAESDIMAAFGYTNEIYQLAKAKPVGVLTDGTKKLIVINESKISEKKVETVLYKATTNEEFKRMALRNDGASTPYPLANFNRNQFEFLGQAGGISFNKLHDGGYFIFSIDREAPVPPQYELLRYVGIWQAGKAGQVYANDAYTANKFNNWYFKNRGL